MSAVLIVDGGGWVRDDTGRSEYHDGVSYVANTKDDCRCEVSKNVFAFVQSVETAVRIGCVTGEPSDA